MTEAAATLGGVVLTSGVEKPKRFSMLLWGPAKSGKTTLAATAPGKKLWINFDPDGLASLVGREDIVIADYAAEKPKVIVQKLLRDDCLDLGNFLQKQPEIETVVFDSVTKFRDKAIAWATETKGLKLEEPGQRGYVVSNNYIKQVVANLVRVCMETGRNVIFIAHEGAPEKTDEGHVIQISLALGGSLTVDLSATPSEVWHVSDVDGKRRICIRPCRKLQPMGSRMFDTSGEPEFVWKYDPVKNPNGDGIAQWFKQWQETGKKIPLPK